MTAPGSETASLTPQKLYELGASEQALLMIKAKSSPTGEDLLLTGRCALSLDLIDSAISYFTAASNSGSKTAQAYLSAFSDAELVEDRLVFLRRLEPINGSFDGLLEMWDAYLNSDFLQCKQYCDKLRASGVSQEFFVGFDGLLETHVESPDWERVVSALEVGRVYSSEMAHVLANIYIVREDFSSATRVFVDAVVRYGCAELLPDVGDYYANQLESPELGIYWYGLGLAHGYSDCAFKISRALKKSDGSTELVAAYKDLGNAMRMSLDE